MRSIIALGLLSSVALFAAGCETATESEAESFDQTAQALSTSYLQTGTTLFKAFSLYQNCTLTLQTAGATSTRDPVLGLIIDNGSPLAYGSATMPCYHGTPTATDGYTTLAFGDNISGSNYNAKVSYKDTNGGAGLTVFAVGFLKDVLSATSFGPLNVNYTIAGCSDTSKNATGVITQDFQASGVQKSLSGYVYTWEPRPGGPQDATDTVLYELNPTVNGSGVCNDDCPAPLGTPYQSCISGNSGSNLWYFSAGWYSNGFSSIVN